MNVKKDATGDVLLELNSQEAQSLILRLSRHADKGHVALLNFVLNNALLETRTELRHPAHSQVADASHSPRQQEG